MTLNDPITHHLAFYSFFGSRCVEANGDRLILSPVEDNPGPLDFSIVPIVYKFAM